MSTTMSHLDPEEEKRREYRERTKKISADRLVPYEIFRLRVAIGELSSNLGKRASLIESVLEVGLEAIALAASTPEDNSAQILEHAAKVRSVREKLKTAIDKQTKGE